MLNGKCLPKSIFIWQILLKWLFLILMLNQAELTEKSPALNDCHSGSSSNGHTADSEIGLSEDAQKSNFSNAQKLHKMCTRARQIWEKLCNESLPVNSSAA